jgi:uncharacterized membrane protein YkvA (DUF1232 family)
MKQHETSPGWGPKWLLDVIKNLRLAWRLFRDPALPTVYKLIPTAALLYVLFPADFIPDLIPGLGQLDDLTVLLLGLRTFIEACPAAIVDRHLAQMSSVDGSYRVVDEERQPAEDAPRYLEAREREEGSDAAAFDTQDAQDAREHRTE